MVRAKVVILVLLCCLLFSEIDATPTTPPKKVLVSDSLKYINIVLESELIKSIGDWQVIAIESPYHLDYSGDNSNISPWVYTEVKLQEKRKIKNNIYKFSCSFYLMISGNTLSGMDEKLSDILKINNLIEQAMSDSLILSWVDKTKSYNVNCTPDKILFKSIIGDVLYVWLYHGKKMISANIVLESELINSTGDWQIVVDERVDDLNSSSDVSTRYSTFSSEIGLQKKLNYKNNKGKLIFHLNSINKNERLRLANNLSDLFKIKNIVEQALLDSTVLFFVNSTNFYNAMCHPDYIKFKSNNDDVLIFDNQQGVKKLKWQSENLIDSLLNYVNLSHIFEAYKEFKNILGVDVFELNNEEVVLLSDYIPKEGKEYFSYAPAGKISYRLPRPYSGWKKTFFYEKIVKIIHKNLFIDTLSSCGIGEIAIDWRDKYLENNIFYDVSISFKCNRNDSNWKTATMVLYPNGTFENLKIK